MATEEKNEELSFDDFESDTILNTDNLLDNDELKLQLPKCIRFEYDKIVQDRKVFRAKKYDEELCEKMIQKNILKKQKRDKEISLRGKKESKER